MGWLYKRGTIWWANYYINGRPIRESARTDKESEALRWYRLATDQGGCGCAV